MKKICIILAIVISSGILFVNANEKSITDALKTCSPYTESGTVKTEGMVVKSTKNIVGWQGDKCVYKENLNFSGINATTSCKLTKSQINEIVSITNAYALVQQTTGEDVDTSSLDAVQNNPVVKVWSKYLQDGSTCTVETH